MALDARMSNSLEDIHANLGIRSALACNAAAKSTVWPAASPASIDSLISFRDRLSHEENAEVFSETINECIAGSPACHWTYFTYDKVDGWREDESLSRIWHLRPHFGAICLDFG